MAIFFLRVQTIRRAAGRSATAAAAYRSGTRIRDARTGETHDYSRRRGVLDTGLIGWAGSRGDLWNAAEAAESRRDAVVGREVLVGLPHELPPAAQAALLSRLGDWLRARHGVAVDWCLHAPDRAGDQRNSHGHILITSRRVEGRSFGPKTIELDRRPASRQCIEDMRRGWAQMVNAALARHGTTGRVDGRSHARQAAATGSKPRLPVAPLGPATSRRGQRDNPTWAAMENARRKLAFHLQEAHADIFDLAFDRAQPHEERQLCR